MGNPTGTGGQAPVSAVPLAGAGLPDLGGLAGLSMPDLGMLGGGGLLDPTVMQQMLQNPQIQQMMQGLLSNPQYMNQVMFFGIWSWRSGCLQCGAIDTWL